MVPLSVTGDPEGVHGKLLTVGAHRTSPNESKPGVAKLTVNEFTSIEAEVFASENVNRVSP